MAYPFGDRTSLRALALSTRVHHLLKPDGVALQSSPTRQKRTRFRALLDKPVTQNWLLLL